MHLYQQVLLKMMQSLIEREKKFLANHYNPLPVMLCKGQGVYVWDTEGKQYLDCLAAYSAINQGHCHPRLVNALTAQAQQLTLASSAFHNDKLAAFVQRLCELTHQDKALPMNSGAEAVETAIKAARKWAYTVKGVAKDQAHIITCEGNFHGRTTTIVGFSSEPQCQENFGPFSPGFVNIPYGDAQALADTITPQTAAFLVEPIQGEGGVVIPPAGYLKQCADICQQHNVLLICDEIQCGLGRTGAFLTCDHDAVTPDGLLLGKSLSGGLLPVSMFLSKASLMAVFTPGDHGSTFGGNSLAAAVGLEAINTLIDERLSENAAQLGTYFLEQLQTINSPWIKEVRGKGLFIGIEIDPQKITSREICHRFIEQGILCKDTHDSVVRLTPPLIITKAQIDTVISITHHVFQSSGPNIS